jgi:hypothetical protein
MIDANETVRIGRTRFKCLLLLALLIGGCPGGQFPPPHLSDAEIAALGVQQGIAGRNAVRDGNCMPGCTIEPCHVEPIGLTLRVLQPEPALIVPSEVGAMCQLQTETWNRLWGQPLQPDASPSSVAEIDLTNRDEFALSLDAGTYQVVLVDDSGCAFCPRTEDEAGVIRCGRVTVAWGQVVPYDIILNLEIQ